MTEYWWGTGGVLVRYWWSTGEVLAKYWWSTGEVLVEYWRSTGGVLVGYSGGARHILTMDDIDQHGHIRLDVAKRKREQYEYSQRLLMMSATRNFEVGRDGAPNWPDPPCAARVAFKPNKRFRCWVPLRMRPA